jgi:ankyrin repeat protein
MINENPDIILNPHLDGVEDDWTLLMLCCLVKGRTEMIKICIDKGADVNANEGLNDITALICSVERGNYKAVKLLLESGANVDGVNSHNCTPLFFSNNIRITRLLLKYGADINMTNKCGLYPLTYHINAESSLPILNLLLERGTVFQPGNNSGMDSFIKACIRNNFPLVKLMVEKYKANLNISYEKGKTLLTICSGFSSIEILDYLMKHGADVNKANNNGQTPLFFAVKRGDEKCVSFLLDMGADIHHKSNNGENVVTLSAVSIPSMTELLISRGGKILVRYLFSSIRLRKHDNIEYAVNKFPLSTLSKMKFNRKTLLMAAAEEGDYKSVKILLERGVDPKIEDEDGNTYLDYSERSESCSVSEDEKM